ncbi:MAG: glycine betaine/L-proline ABC transporter ATP-binding protein ProV [Bdellovibrio sp.]|nr:glycine betaine/L-proline ABC transporter ATP-binding protein ProV [Methylotenera sp.]
METTSEAKVVVKNLYKVFGNKPDTALQMLYDGKHKDDVLRETGQVVGVLDASFEINQGEIFVLMGLSGSGKSTLIRLLNRLIEPTAGSVIVDGQDVAKMSKENLLNLRRKDMSMVFQSFALLPHRSVIENAAFGLEIAGVELKEREQRAMQVLEQVGLDTFARHMPSELSGGMQQRVGLARALTVNPSLMLMDEAFSALDPLRRTEMQDVLIKLQQEQKRTIVFVSHDLDEALRIGNRICIMEGGRVVQVGTSDEILQRPANDYVKAFFNGVDTNKYLTAKDIAQKEQVTIFERPDDPANGFSAALERMRLYDRVYAFVLDEQQKIVGIVSAESLVHCINQGGKKLRDALLPGDFAIPENTPLNQILHKVVNTPCPLPVVNAYGEYIGAITKTALLRKLCKEKLA